MASNKSKNSLQGNLTREQKAKGGRNSHSGSQRSDS